MEAGASEERLATLCRIAGGFDRGLFEATGVRFSTSPGCRGMAMAAAISGWMIGMAE